MNMLMLCALYLLASWCLMYALPVVTSIPQVHWKSVVYSCKNFLKLSFNVLIAFLAKFCLCMCSGTFSYSMTFCHMVLRNLSDAWLLSMCFVAVTPQSFNHCMILLYDVHISPDVLVFIGLTRMRFPSLLYITMMYWFLWLDATGNFTVLSMFILFFMSSMVTLTSLNLCCGTWTICVLWLHSLLLLPCLLFLSFGWLRKVFCYGCCCEHWLGGEEFCFYCFEPGWFCGESWCWMVIVDYLFCAW